MGEGKKLALLRVLQILEKYSDADHPLTHEDISAYLYKDFDIEADRKFVAKQLTLLHEAYDVLSSPIVIISDMLLAAIVTISSAFAKACSTVVIPSA